VFKIKLLVIGFLLAFGFSALVTHTAYAQDNGNIIVKTIPGPTVGDKFTARAKSSWSWYLTRASGLVAAATLVILILSGIGQVTGYTFRFLDPLTSWASHRALGIAFTVSVLVHILSLLFDHFVKFSILDIFIPWLSNYKPVTLFGWHLGSLYVALGVISFYLVIIVLVTSLLWVDKKPHMWKWIHLLSYLTIAFVFIHALYIGTDIAHGIIRWIWIALALGILVATVHRLWRLRNI
jgi:DMSO/TMAO reductase YedYZ heme-binding membrane subunit